VKSTAPCAWRATHCNAHERFTIVVEHPASCATLSTATQVAPLPSGSMTPWAREWWRLTRLHFSWLTLSRTYASTRQLPVSLQGSLPACGSTLWPSGIRTHWMGNPKSRNASDHVPPSGPAFTGRSHWSNLRRPSPLLALTLNSGSFPPPALHRLRRSYQPVRHPQRPGLTSRVSGWVLTHPPLWTSRVALPSLSTRAAVNIPAERQVAFVTHFPDVPIFPELPIGSASPLLFRDPLNVHYALRPAWSPSHPRWPSTPKALIASSPPRPLRLLPLERHLPGGSISHWESARFHGARKIRSGLSRPDRNSSGGHGTLLLRRPESAIAAIQSQQRRVRATFNNLALV